MYDKAVHTFSFAFDFDLILDRYKTQKMCDKAFSEALFMLKNCLDRYKTQEIDKAVDKIFATITLVNDWFLTKKMIKKLYNAFSQMIICFCDEQFSNVTFTTDKMYIICINFNNINVDEANFYEDDPTIIRTIINVRRLTWHNKLKQRKVFKK